MSSLSWVGLVMFERVRDDCIHAESEKKIAGGDGVLEDIVTDSSINAQSPPGVRSYQFDQPQGQCRRHAGTFTRRAQDKDAMNPAGVQMVNDASCRWFIERT